MSDKMFNERQKIIFTAIKYGQEYALSDILSFFEDIKKPSLATLRRDVTELRERGYLNQSGELKGTRYRLSSFGMLNMPINPHEFCNIDVDIRGGNKSYNFSIFSEINDSIFTKETVSILEKSTNLFLKKSLGVSDTIRQKELERFVIELSWKSSRIEGNTYTLLDTERLIKEGILAEGHSNNEAVMILNHKKAFQYVLENADLYKNISLRLIEDVHLILIEGLDVSFGLRHHQVGVIGSNYIPLSVPSQIKEALEGLCSSVNMIKNPYIKAFTALLGISYIQPFEDGNKRTARIITNAILLSNKCAPLSYRSVNEVNYRESMLVFYEKNSLSAMRDIFTSQYIFSCEQYLSFTK